MSTVMKRIVYGERHARNMTMIRSHYCPLRMYLKLNLSEKKSKMFFSLNWIRKEEPKKQEDDSKQCYGTDPNRNWNYRWNEAGASQSPCSDVYAGPRSFSEPETKALSKFLMEHKKNFKVTIN